MNSSPKPSQYVFFWPLVIAAFTAVGLAAALIGGPGWAPVSWLALGIPLAALATRLLRAPRR